MSPVAAKKKAIEEAKKKMVNIAALHEPDMIAGGKDVVVNLGDRSVNSSIGSQWRTRVPKIDDEVSKIPEAQRATTTMNVKLDCGK